MPECVLCHYKLSELRLTFDKDPREYFLCGFCQLVQVEKKYIPPFEKAKIRYKEHEADAGSAGHILHLKKAIAPSVPYLKRGYKCLDYGCGPKPILAGLLKMKGFECDHYDPYFGFTIASDMKYNHIFCVETAEHFERPDIEFKNLFEKLLPGGGLTLMTERYINLEQFSEWHYKRDFTHLIFFHQKTLLYIKNKMGVNKVYDDGRRVVIYHKPLKIMTMKNGNL